ncbi:alkaline phosphatase family protein [Botrimarina mediterranea]|uniref:Type I phosphodiesterase / nucleotide pyrophosphatase n=1 Tax=Botrimarina mediterranea TaxID=2528022 RepID=A0A518K941_9BACT|nr:alkaline phosphatase family protein [Botrimarina mediterranea]QDV74297.1 Type I phosphodiesterase / nucleotide pyrophosphatase [Botrimarina mediterranea]
MGLAKRVLLIGWAGADWSMVHPLLDAGDMPCLEGLVNTGSIGRIATLQPGVGPLVWSSIATGVRPARHGVTGYLRRKGDAATPMSGGDRTAPAFWDICSAAGLTTHIVNWPTYPAEPACGAFVSHLFTRSSGHLAEPWSDLPRGVTPGLEDVLAPLRIDPRELGPAELLPFVPRADRVDQECDPGLAILAGRLADAASAHAMATALLDSDWQVAAVVYDLIDRLGHAFMRFHPPKGQVTQRSFDLYRGVMTQAYRFCDQMLGRLLQLAGEDMHVMLFSDHGLRSAQGRPARQSTGRGDTQWHSPFGLLAIRGPGIHADRWVWGGNLLDICPTVLHLLGMPTEGLDGRVLEDALETPPSAAVPSRLVTTDPQRRLDPLNVREADALRQWLVDDGYAREETLQSKHAAQMADDACAFNLAQSHLQFGDYATALRLLLDCHRRRPEVAAYAITAARCHAALGDLDAAQRLVESVIEHDAPSWLGDRLRGQLLAAEGQLELALERLLLSESVEPRQAGVNAEIGTIYDRLGRTDEARRAFHKELRVHSNDATALRGLGKLSLAEGDNDAALEWLLSSASSQEVCPETHYLLAKTLKEMGRLLDALRAVEKALRQAPTYAEAIELSYILAEHCAK